MEDACLLLFILAFIVAKMVIEFLVEIKNFYYYNLCVQYQNYAKLPKKGLKRTQNYTTFIRKIRKKATLMYAMKIN
jgi:hypothetical protein